jgi:hypothetical protein
MTSPAERAIALQRLAERAGTPAEAEAAARALSNHLAKHQLQLAEVESEEAPTLSTEPVVSGQRIAIWRYNLIIALGRLYGAAPFLDVSYPDGRARRRGRKQRRKLRAVRLCGRPADLERVVALYRQLGADVERLGREHDGDRRSFRMGFVAGLVASAAEGLSAAQEGASSTAMVHVGGRYDDALEHLRKRTGVGAPRTSYVDACQDSYALGYQEGKQRTVGERLADKEHA